MGSIVSYLSPRVDLSILSHFVTRRERHRTCAERENELDRLQEAMHAIEIILKELPKTQSVPLGRSFYYKPGKNPEDNELGGGRWVWDGFFQSIRPGQWKPFINIDKTCGVFVKPVALLEFILRMLDTSDLNLAFDPNNRKNSQKISDHLYNIRVIANHMKYPKRCRVVSRGKVLLKSARNEMFDKDGKMISVEQYFLQQYGVILKHPLIPCINVGEFICLFVCLCFNVYMPQILPSRVDIISRVFRLFKADRPDIISYCCIRR